MKVISLKQPWASLIALDLKRIETRSWYTSYRGLIGIHAGKTIAPFSIFDDIEQNHRDFIWDKLKLTYGDYNQLPTGAIIAVADLYDAVAVEKIDKFLDGLERDCGDYSPGRFAWRLKHIKQLKQPIRIKGRLGLWDYEGQIAV